MPIRCVQRCKKPTIRHTMHIVEEKNPTSTRASTLKKRGVANRISKHMAFITAFHHRDVDLFRRWRGIIYICCPEWCGDGDSATFARDMWKLHLTDGRIPLGVDRRENLEFAYWGLFHAFEEARQCFLNHDGLDMANMHEKVQILSDIKAIESRLEALNGKWRTKHGF